MLIAATHLPSRPLHLVALMIHLEPTTITASSSLIPSSVLHEVIVSCCLVVPLHIGLTLELLPIVLLLMIHVLALLRVVLWLLLLLIPMMATLVSAILLVLHQSINYR